FGVPGQRHPDRAAERHVDRQPDPHGHGHPVCLPPKTLESAALRGPPGPGLFVKPDRPAADVAEVTHMVIFRRPEGKPGYHQAESADDAIRFVEMLRNQEQVNDAHIFRMEEVPFEFRTVYKVELLAQDGTGPSPSPSPEVDGV